jgi:hypothetical protein
MAKDGFIDPNWPNPHGPHDARIIIYGFVPSFALCLIAIILFFLMLMAHLFQTIKYRAWYFLPFVLGILMEVVGYIARSLSAKKDPYNIPYFVLEYFFIVVAPVFFTASIYVCLNKLIAWSQDVGFNASRSRWLHPRWILIGFLASDLVTTAMQIAGAATVGKRESDRKDPTTANNILLAGLAVQTLSFTTFLFILIVFVISLEGEREFGPDLRGKSAFVAALLSASVLILLRIVFRLAETSQGVFGFLMTHEAFFGALEFAPVIVAVGILALWHPGRSLPTSKGKKRRGTREGAMEMGESK